MQWTDTWILGPYLLAPFVFIGVLDALTRSMPPRKKLYYGIGLGLFFAGYAALIVYGIRQGTVSAERMQMPPSVVYWMWFAKFVKLIKSYGWTIAAVSFIVLIAMELSRKGASMGERVNACQRNPTLWILMLWTIWLGAANWNLHRIDSLNMHLPKPGVSSPAVPVSR